MSEGAVQSNERELWRRSSQGEPFRSEASVSLSGEDGILICVGGRCIAKPIEEWMKMAVLFERMIVRESAPPLVPSALPMSSEQIESEEIIRELNGFSWS